MSKTHWTGTSPEKFQFAVSFHFIDQIQDALEQEGLSQKDLAATLKVSPGRVSQVVNDPGNLTLKSMVSWAQAINRKIGVVLYDDGDRENKQGPIDSALFRLCWEKQGRPRDFGDNHPGDEYSYDAEEKSLEPGSRCDVISLPQWRTDHEESEDVLQLGSV